MSQPTETSSRAWQPLTLLERRVVGVLIEKAKTTPDVYPMSINAICSGASQKSNRNPVIGLEPEQAEPVLESLRAKGAILLVQGGGRVERYRHVMYDWLGVDKVELAVMAELLLRGPQTEGELRARAARMEPIADLTALRPVLDSLRAKGLLIFLTPEGRGQVLSHALYLPREMEKLRAEYGQIGAAAMSEASDEPASPAVVESVGRAVASRSAVSQSGAAHAGTAFGISSQRELENLRSQVCELKEACRELRTMHEALVDELQSCRDQIDRLQRDLGG